MAVTRLPAIILDMNLAWAVLQHLLDPLLIVVELLFCNCTYGLIGDMSLCNFDRGVEVLEDISKVFIVGD